jgi:hypothetical protein
MNDKTRTVLAAALAAGSVFAWLASGGKPTPAPQPDGGLSLRGKFVGESASADAATLGSLCEAVASCIEYDGMQDPPRMTTGIQFDDLRVQARELRLKGDSIGKRQPKVRAEMDRYLTEHVGTNGGAVSPEQRSTWVAAYREIGRAANDAAR